MRGKREVSIILVFLHSFLVFLVFSLIDSRGVRQVILIIKEAFDIRIEATEDLLSAPSSSLAHNVHLFLFIFNISAI